MIRLTRTTTEKKNFDVDFRAKKNALGIADNAVTISLSIKNAPTLLALLQQIFQNALPDESSSFQLRIISEFLTEDASSFKNIISSPAVDTWIVSLASCNNVVRKTIFIVLLDCPINVSYVGMTPVSVMCLVLYPENSENNVSLESMAQSLGTLLSNRMFFRLLPTAKRKSDLQLLIRSQTDCYITKNVDKKLKESTRFFNILTGVKENVLRRLYFYASDFGDGIKDWKSFSKVVSSSVFLFFLCILPCVAFGVLNSKNTDDKLNADRALIGQAVGGFLFSVMSGQPFVIIATTAPMSLCTRIIFMLSQSLGVEFYSLYALVGLFNCFFLVLYGLLGMSTVITFSRRCVEEIFLIFSFVCFLNDAFADAYHLFFVDDGESCNMACRLLFLLLLLLTSFICHVMYNFKFSRFGNSLIRDLVSDYAVPLSVVVFSLIGYFIKSSILVEYYMLTGKVDLQIASFDGLWDTQILVLAVLLGFAISLLFFMDQGISAQLVNTPMHGLKKGNANDYDLVVVGIINILTSLFGLPFMHGLLPHSPLHVHSLADWEERLMDDTGIVKRVIVQVRETRLATIFCHILISLTVVFCPQVFSEIPVAVLDGLFLYCAFACLRDNSFFDRLLLLVTQKSKYPPSHYIRTCPQDKVHLFTGIELVLTVFLVYIGFSPLPLLKIFFPVIIAFLIPIRHLLLRKVIGSKFVKALDSY